MQIDGFDAMRAAIEANGVCDSTSPLELNGREFAAFVAPTLNASGCATFRDGQLITFLFTPQDDSDFMLEAAEIMAKETKTMIDATKTLFYALQVKGIADFGNVDAAAFSFAMAVHAIIDYRFDLEQAGLASGNDLLRDYIDEFCRLYGVGKGNEKNR